MLALVVAAVRLVFPPLRLAVVAAVDLVQQGLQLQQEQAVRPVAAGLAQVEAVLPVLLSQRKLPVAVVLARLRLALQEQGVLLTAAVAAVARAAVAELARQPLAEVGFLR